MRNRKFRLSDMIPNAWFYKLQEISSQQSRSSNNLTAKNHRQPPPPPQFCSRKSYYFNRDLKSNDGFSTNSPLPPPLPPRKSEKQNKPRTRTSSRAPEPEFRMDNILAADSQSFERDIVIDISSNYCLPQIITNQKKKHEKRRTTTADSSGGVRLRNHSPRIGHRKMRGRKSTAARRSLSDSLAVMKPSCDPGRDFRESMVEMIVENNIRAPKDLEDLLACYLCLNADEYHDLIINVFKQIWFDLTELSL